MSVRKTRIIVALPSRSAGVVFEAEQWTDHPGLRTRVSPMATNPQSPLQAHRMNVSFAYVHTSPGSGPSAELLHIDYLM